MKMRNQFIILSLLTDDFGNSVSGWNKFYDPRQRKWVDEKDVTFPGLNAGLGLICKSVKAAKRHLRRHDEIPKGTKFILESRFMGFDRVLTK